MPSAGELLRDLAQIGRIFQRLTTQMHAGRGQSYFGAAQVFGCGVPALEGTGKSHPGCQSSCYNVAMRSTSIRELHIHTSELVREAEAGNVIVIERRGEPVAQLQALSQRPAMPEATVSRVFRELRELRAETPAGSGVDQALTDDRARY